MTDQPLSPAMKEGEERAARKLIVTNIISLDGYYEGPGGNVMVLPMDDAFDTYNAERLAAADTLLLGRNSYELFKSFWPQMADNPDATPAHRAISRLEDAIEKVVISDSLTEDETDPWRQTTRIVRRRDAHQAVAELKSRPGGEVLVFASRTLWRDLLAAGLVDELHLIVGAVVLGGGTPAFATDSEVSLSLLGTHTWEGSANVLVRYSTAAVAR